MSVYHEVNCVTGGMSAADRALETVNNTFQLAGDKEFGVSNKDYF